jgi:hypothetical protein
MNTTGTIPCNLKGNTPFPVRFLTITNTTSYRQKFKIKEKIVKLKINLGFLDVSLFEPHPSDGTVLKAELSKNMKNTKARRRHNILSDNTDLSACRQLAQTHVQSHIVLGIIHHMR